MAILTFEQKHDFWKRPFNLSTQNLLCIEYGHLDLSKHDLGKALSFCPSKIYSALYVHPDFGTNFNEYLYLYLYLICKYLMYLSTFQKNEYLTSTCTWYIFGVLGVLEYLVNCT